MKLGIPIQCRRYCFGILMFLFAQNVFANSFNVKIEVKEQGSHEALFGATILSSTGVGAITDLDGIATLQLPKGECFLYISYVGYNSDTLQLDVKSDLSLQVELEPTILQETVILGQQKLSPGTQATGVLRLSGATLEKLPTFLGEREVMKAIQLLPGVQSGNEGARGIFVRGGGPDQNLVLYEGAPIFNVAHLYGVFSVFNSDVLGNVDLHKNHLPSRYGGRLASVLEVNTKVAPFDKTLGGFQIGLFSSKAHFSTPIIKDKLSVQTAIRACYAGLISKPLSEKLFEASTEAGYITYYFYDINTSLYYKVSDKHLLSFHFFRSDDIYTYFERWAARYPDQAGFRFISDKNNQLRWNNLTNSFRWDAHLNESWTFKQDVYLSKYQLISKDNTYKRYQSQDIALGENNTLVENVSSILEVGAKGEAHAVFKYHHLQLGYSALFRNFNTGKGNIQETVIGFPTESTFYGGSNQGSSEVDFFAEYSFQHPKWRFDAGLRSNYYTAYDGFKRWSLQPRTMLEAYLPKSLTWQFAASRAVQNVHLLTSSAGNILNDIWVPANGTALPETAWQFGAGFRQKLPKSFEWSVDAFYRLLTGAIEYSEGSSYITNGQDWLEQVAVNGEGRVYGVETFVAKSAGDFTAWAKYTYSKSDRLFDNLNRGQWFPFKYDRTHDVSLTLSYKLNSKIDFSLSWVYGTGNTFTLPSVQYPALALKDVYQYNPDELLETLRANDLNIRYFESRNNYRLKAFHHLDVGMNYRWEKKKVKHLFNVSVYNIYNRLNVFNVYLKYTDNPDGTFNLKYNTLSIMPVLPSFSYAVSF